MRTRGAKNVVSFANRTDLETSTSKQVRHLADIGGNPVTEFQNLLRHQANFLDWVEDRHERIVEYKIEINTLRGAANRRGPKGAKEETFVKYRWYSEQLVLLEAINAFEVFYKKTFIELGEILQPYVQPEAMKDSKIDARLLWSLSGNMSVPAMLFEQKLFHDLDAVDEVLEMLIGSKRYKQQNPAANMVDRVRSLRSIFQVRHTLSHNNGLVTDSDAAKYRRLRLRVAARQVIDPSKNHLGVAIFRELVAEAKDFTDWLANAAATFLTKCVNDRGVAVPTAKRTALTRFLGRNACWASVPWS